MKNIKHFTLILLIYLILFFSILANQSFATNNIWSNAANMPETRAWQAQSTLLDGRVLVTGGYNNGATNTAYIYNPVNNTWNSAANMPSVRDGHAQSTLLDGRVLVTGGYNGVGAPSSTGFIFDPATNKWSSVSDMPDKLEYHSQSTLLDGRVLVTGGYNNGIYTNTAYIYNPLTNTWSSAANMPGKRLYHNQSTLLDGRVLVTGGWDGIATLSSSIVYDPTTNSWSSVANIPQPKNCHGQSTLSNGKVLITGGANGLVDTNTAYMYNPVTNVWSSVANLPEIRAIHAQSTLQNGVVLITGGYNNVSNYYYNSTLLYTYNTIPSIAISSPIGNWVYSPVPENNTIYITGTICDADSSDTETIYYRIDDNSKQSGIQLGSTVNANGSNQVFSESIGVNIITEGSHTLYVWVQDNNGGKSSEVAIPFKIDKTLPSVSTPTLTNSTSQITVTASASDPTSNGVSSGINSYLFNRNGNDIGTWQSTNSYTDSGLLPNTQYTYKYMARDNVMNTSGYSTSMSKYTLAQVPIITNNSVTSTSINLGASDNNPAGTKYQIYTVDSNGNPKNYVTSTGTLFTTAQWITLTNKTISVTGLTPNTTYTFKAKAMNGDGVVTSESVPVSATTKLAVPSNISYTYTTPSNLKISWSPVQGASSYSVSDGSNTYTTPNTYYAPTGIMPGKKYTYQVSAVNGSVYSDSSAITIITPLDKPNVTATATSTSITLYWDTITSANGYDITVGDITRSTTGTSITINGLESNKTYTYSVRAKNDVTTGAWSTAQNKITRLTIPGVPQNINATPSSNAINITWDVVDGATTYEVSVDGKTISVGAATSYNDTGLEPGTQHNYQIRAINSGGKSAWSSSVTAKTTPLNPSVPANLKATAANKDITLTWDPVDKASGYEIEIDNPDQSVTENTYIHSATGTAYTQKGLVSGSTHTYRIRSVIDGVQGPWSSAVSITTGTNPQGAPQNISTTISDTSATLMWDSVSSATSYDIEENGVVTGHVKGSISYKAIGLTPNTSYSFRIRAVNSAGKGDWSDPVTITTLSEPAMDVPGNIKAIPTSNSINLIWNPVDKATGYEIEIDGNTVKTVTNNMFTYADLHPETTYKFRVRAVSQGVPADWSGEVSTTTLSASEQAQTSNYLTANYTVNAVQGQAVTMLLTATDLQGLNTSKFIVIYDPDVLELSDLNATTLDAELSAGNIHDTDINIKELAPGTIQFTLNTPVEKGESFSGLVDSIKFVAKKDGQSTITYSIVNTSNAYLRSLDVSSGKLSPDFTDTTLAYNLKVKSDVTSITFTPTAENPEAVIKINGVEVTSGQASAPIDLKAGDNIVTVEVTTADGTVNKYIITITRDGGAYLTGLDLSSGTLDPVFSQTQDTYKVKVDKDTTSITLTPTAEAPNSVIKVNGVEVASGQASAPIDLKVGDNIVTIEVTTADGTVNTYTITVTREGGAYLTGLDLSVGTLDPVFSQTQDTYKVKVDKDTTSITLTPATNQPNAVIKVNGVEVTSGQASAPIELKVGDNIVTVEVTAADGTVNKYTITVTREGGAYLTGLDLSTGTLNPVFDDKSTNYTVNVANDISSITLTPATDHPDAVIKVNGVEVTSGQASAPIDLKVGDNTITIEVSTSDGTVNTYTITVTREGGAYLTGLDLSTGTLDPVFREKQITYSTNVGNDITNIKVSPTAKYTDAVIKVNGVDVASGQASGPIDLQEGNNVISVEVTAADGTVSTYTITVVKAINTDKEASIQIESIN